MPDLISVSGSTFTMENNQTPEELTGQMSKEVLQMRLEVMNQAINREEENFPEEVYMNTEEEEDSEEELDEDNDNLVNEFDVYARKEKE